ncbi:hypothetical protein CSV61_06690 [Sporosarcina sp. P3]|uniref:hypothetical protein n=1 Tax=Sporosarcina sp. P3 TaxID=2048245 RepID=UPI000C1704D7|nr:hypothetical protein [Sporosarcina sp. P3]PID21900.1 hypothetical protein CSV61_06690 [Sporosarcina sp. P3]
MNEKTYLDFLYFGYKKAKHFVTVETSFTDQVDILLFEKDLKSNIEYLNELLKAPEELHSEIKGMEAYLYFFPKSNGPNDEVRMRPKVSFPFKYQVLWATVILIIGEWFDTNEKIKNTYSICDENTRKQFDWMVPWSFNGRLKRLNGSHGEDDNNTWSSSYIHYNDKRLYESHQMALRKFNAYKLNEIDKMMAGRNKIFIGELDIREFFPTLKKDFVKKALRKRLLELQKIKGFDTKHFDIKKILTIINALLQIQILYPDKDEISPEYLNILKSLYEQLNDKDDFNIDNLVSFLNSTLPLDLIASNFLSNCTLNYFVDIQIQADIREANKVGDISVLRYTDDYTFISNNEKDIIEYIEKVKMKMKTIDLEPSLSKTLPTDNSEILKILNQLQDTNKAAPAYVEILKNEIKSLKVNPANYDENLKKQLVWLGITICPNVIVEKCIETSHITKSVSTTVDIKLKALSDQELDMFIQEMLFYMSADNDLGELKEETVKVFAAWRLKNSYNEIICRTTLKKEQLKKFFCLLIEAIKKYPYKMGFYDVYVLMILKLIEDQDDGYEEFKSFLLGLSKNVEYSNGVNSIYFSTIRSRIMNIMSNNWYAFTNDQRKKLIKIFDEVFLQWYAVPFITWTEKCELYWSFSIMRLRLPLQLCKISNVSPSNLKTLCYAYDKYIFPYPGSNNVLKNNTSENALMVGIKMLKEGLYWDKEVKEYDFEEIDHVIYKILKKDILSEDNVDISNWLSFAKVSFKYLNKELFYKLDEITKGNDLSTLLQDQKKELYFEVQEFIHYSIKKYFENPKKFKGIFEWCEDENNNGVSESPYKSFAQERFESFSRIRKFYSVTDDRSVYLPKQHKDPNEKTSIADWIFYCELLPYNLEMITAKQNVLHSLAEYEYVNLLVLIIKRNIKVSKNKANNVFDENNLYNIKIDFNDWESVRNEIFIENFNKNLDVDVLDTKYYAKLLFSMLTNRPVHSHITKEYSFYKWNDLQSYFELTYYPSSKIASFFVDNLNIHQGFYQDIYGAPLERLPYRDVSRSKSYNNDILDFINDYFVNIKDELITKKYNRKLELLEIDTDQLRR